MHLKGGKVKKDLLWREVLILSLKSVPILFQSLLQNPRKARKIKASKQAPCRDHLYAMCDFTYHLVPSKIESNTFGKNSGDTGEIIVGAIECTWPRKIIVWILVHLLSLKCWAGLVKPFEGLQFLFFSLQVQLTLNSVQSDLQHVTDL